MKKYRWGAWKQEAGGRIYKKVGKEWNKQGWGTGRQEAVLIRKIGRNGINRDEEIRMRSWKAGGRIYKEDGKEWNKRG